MEHDGASVETISTSANSHEIRTLDGALSQRTDSGVAAALLSQIS